MWKHLALLDIWLSFQRLLCKTLVCLFVFLIENVFSLIKILNFHTPNIRDLGNITKNRIVVSSLICHDYFPVQYSSVTQSCSTLCDSMNHSTPGLPVHHHRPEFTQPMSIESVMPSNQSHPLSSPSLPPLIFPSIRVFSNESALQTSNLSNNLLKTSYSKSS